MRSGPSLGMVYKKGAPWFFIPQSSTFLQMAACSFPHFQTPVAQRAPGGPTPRCTDRPPPALGQHHLRPSCKQPGSLSAPALGRPESCFPEAQLPLGSALVLAPSPARGARSARTSPAFHPRRDLRGGKRDQSSNRGGEKPNQPNHKPSKKTQMHHKTPVHVSCLRPPPPGCPPVVTGTREVARRHRTDRHPGRFLLPPPAASLLPSLPLLQTWGGRMTDAIFYKMR